MIHALILSVRCYCSAILASVPGKLLRRQNTALRIRAHFRRRSSTTSLVFDLLRLPNEHKGSQSFSATVLLRCFFPMPTIQFVTFELHRDRFLSGVKCTGQTACIKL